MRVSDIISRGKSYLFLGLTGVLAISILIFLGYFIVYKKIMKGEKTLPLYKIVLFDIFICYLAVVIGAVFLDRSRIYKRSNLYIFSSYREAWYKYSSTAWRNIILNIILFIPMGVLLPLFTNRLQKLWRILLVGFSVTLFIECVQYFSALGIFEIDDIFNNFLGVSIGGGATMGIIKLYKKEIPIMKAVLYFVPLFTTVLGFGSIFLSYHRKEFGNMADTYYYKQNMNNVEVSCTIGLTDDKPISGVYRTEILKEADTRTFAEWFFHGIGASFDESRSPQIYDESAFYYSDNRCHLVVNYKGKSYRYNDFTCFDFESDSSAQETVLRSLLLGFGINIPGDAVFINNENGDYTFIADMSSTGEYFVDGSLTCTYYEDGTIKNIDNYLLECTYVRDCSLISQNEALKQIKEGKFNPHFQNLQSVKITAIELDYILDSKGFYQPVYRFAAVINNSEDEVNIIIPALDK